MGASPASASPDAATSAPPAAPHLQHHSGDQVNPIIPPPMPSTSLSHGS
jgi:hypothetical protein